MQKHAIVVETDGESAKVEVSRRSACEGCHAKDSCHACIMLGDKHELTARALNKVGARVGDRVVVETDSAVVIGYAAAVFLLPIALALAAYLVAGIFTDGTLRYVAALVGFAVAFAFLYFVLDKRAAGRYDVRIVSVIKGDSAISENNIQC